MIAPEIENLFLTLKALLRERGLKYRDLASWLELSEAAVKKFMAERNMDLERLSRICDWLQISVTDLIALANTRAQRSVVFTPEQEEFFADHIPHYSFFNELNKGKSVQDIAEKHHLTKRSTARYLKDLEAIGLLERLTQDRIRLTHRGTFTQWDDRGPIGKKYSNYFIRNMADRALASLETADDVKLWTGSRGLTEDQYGQFEQDFIALTDKYGTMTVANEGSSLPRKPVQILLICDYWRVPFFDDIPNL